MNDLTDRTIMQVFGWEETEDEIRVQTRRFTDRKEANDYLRTLETENRILAAGSANILRAWLIIGAKEG